MAKKKKSNKSNLLADLKINIKGFKGDLGTQESKAKKRIDSFRGF
jgi:hypothetical protein